MSRTSVRRRCAKRSSTAKRSSAHGTRGTYMPRWSGRAMSRTQLSSTARRRVYPPSTSQVLDWHLWMPALAPSDPGPSTVLSYPSTFPLRASHKRLILHALVPRHPSQVSAQVRAHDVLLTRHQGQSPPSHGTPHPCSSSKCSYLRRPATF